MFVNSGRSNRNENVINVLFHGGRKEQLCIIYLFKFLCVLTEKYFVYKYDLALDNRPVI